MTGGLSFLAVGLLVGAAIAWVLPGLSRLLPAARAEPRAEKPAGEPDPGAGPKNDQPSLVKLDADDAARVRDDGAGDDDGEERGFGRPGKPRSQNSFLGTNRYGVVGRFFREQRLRSMFRRARFGPDVADGWCGCSLHIRANTVDRGRLLACIRQAPLSDQRTRSTRPITESDCVSSADATCVLG